MTAPGTRRSGARRDARERAVELLYEAEAKGVHPTEVTGALPLPTDPYAVELATGVVDHRVEIDQLLDRFSQRWSVARMAAMDRTVLRVGVLELATQPDVPTGVCLSEAVELGARYGSTDETSKFVNGLLARIAEELRGDDRDPDLPAWAPIEVVVFDMDGVIRHWTGRRIREFEQAHGLPAGSVVEVAFADPVYRDVMVGTITADEWATAIGESLAERHDGVTAAEGTEMWLGTEWHLDDDVVAIVGRLRDAGQRTAVFSNATTRLEEDMATMGVDGLFDVVANSARLGLAKPDVAAFEAVADLLEVPADRLLFIDDRAENVRGAIEAGWHAVEMHDAPSLIGVLRRLRIPGAAAAS